MRYELFIALRYMRAKRREVFISLITLFSLVGVAIGVMTLNIVLSVMTGFEEDLRDRILRFNAHVLVWSDFGPMHDYRAALERIRGLPEVERAEPFVYAQLMLVTPKSVAGVLVRGVPPEGTTDQLAGNLLEGNLGELNEQFAVPLGGGRGSTVKLPGILLGKDLAAQLGVGPGQTVDVASPLGAATVPSIRRFVVVGRFDAGMPEYDGGLAYIGLANAQKLYDLDDSVTGIEVRVHDVERAGAAARDISRVLGGGYRVRDWTQANHNLFATLRMQKTVYFIVLMLIILVAAFTIVATLIMLVMEKRKDIAVLESIGAPPASVRRIFVFEGLIIGAAGTLIGNLGGYLGCLALRHYHFVELPKEIFYVSTVPVKMYPGYFALVTVASLAMCLLATIYPARQAARVVPIDNLRYE
jgi:lipoprotein-releasing system permease protein